MKNKLWGGRFKKKPDPFMEKFTSSIAYDKKLAEFDCLGSIAHAQMLGKCKIIPKSDSLKIVKGLNSILKAIKYNRFRYSSSIEDIHTAIQETLYKKIGHVALKLHTARSRNDQIALDERMYCKKEIGSLIELIENLKKSIKGFSKKNINVIVPAI